MRRRLNTNAGSRRRCGSEPRTAGVERGRSSRNAVFGGLEKKNPAVGTPGQIFFVIGVYGFKYAAWLLLVAPEGAERLVVIVQPNFCSCSSTFLFFSKVFKFNRTLCGFASFSVRLRTHSSLGGDDVYEARHMPENEKPAKTARYRCDINRGAGLAATPVKAADNAFTRSCSRGK